MLQQLTLTCILFLPPLSTSTGTSVNTTLTHSAATLARMIPQTLCSFSFVLSAFGGVSSGAGGAGRWIGASRCRETASLWGGLSL